MSLLLVGSEDVFRRGATQRLLPMNHFRIIARSTSLQEAKACLESDAIDMVLLSPEYRECDFSLFSSDLRRRGFEGLILLSADMAVGRTNARDKTESPIQVGDFFLHCSSQRVWIRGVEVNFGPLEFSLLQVLCRNPEKPLSHEMLISGVWGHAGASRQALRVLIRAVRLKVEMTSHPRYVVATPNAGYLFHPSPDIDVDKFTEHP